MVPIKGCSYKGEHKLPDALPILWHQAAPTVSSQSYVMSALRVWGLGFGV